ncbi:MAG: hypothetical protein AAGC60_18910 [Acidobacteriota bacterium]
MSTRSRPRPAAADVVVVGGGFAGSILARILALGGRRVVLVDAARQPRFALGESTTPLGNLALERLGRRRGLEDLFALSSYGRWLRALPHLRRGLKRGFTFRAHRRGEPWRDDPARRLLVAASPNDEVADTHWLRAEVDHHLLRRAAAVGVEVREATTVDGVSIGDGGVRLRLVSGGHGGRSGEHSGRSGELGGGGRETLRAGCVVDAAGGAVARRLGVGEAPVPVASALLATHLEGVPERTALPSDGSGDGLGGQGAIVGAPYPEEAAAVHDLADWGWVYQLPFDRVGDRGRRSVGLLVEHRDGVDLERLGEDPAAAVAGLVEPYPSLRRQLSAGRPLRPWLFAPRIQRKLMRAAGERWLALPGAYAFTDPLFSTGIAWSLVGVERLAASSADGEALGGGFDRALAEPAAWHAQLAREADHIERLVAVAYAGFGAFDLFAGAASIYFAGASFGEMRARLGVAEDAGLRPAYGFLGAGDPVIDSALELAEDSLASGTNPERLRRQLIACLEARDIVGLDAPAASNLYPADLRISLERAARLGVTAADLAAVLPPVGSHLQETQ